MQIAEEDDAGVHNRGTGEIEAPRASIVLVSRIARFRPSHAMESDWGVHR